MRDTLGCRPREVVAASAHSKLPLALRRGDPSFAVAPPATVSRRHPAGGRGFPIRRPDWERMAGRKPCEAIRRAALNVLDAFCSAMSAVNSTIASSS